MLLPQAWQTRFTCIQLCQVPADVNQHLPTCTRVTQWHRGQACTPASISISTCVPQRCCVLVLTGLHRRIPNHVVTELQLAQSLHRTHPLLHPQC